MRGKAGDLSRLFHIVKWCRKLGRIHASIQTYEEFIAKKNYEKVDLSAFYRKRAVKAPCFSCGDETALKILANNKFMFYNAKKLFDER